MSPSAPPRSTGLSLALIGAVLLINGAWYFPLMMADPSALMSEYAGQWPFRTFYMIQLAVVVTLAIVLPRLRALTGTTGRRLPAWLIVTLQVFAVLQATTVYAQAFVAPHLARVAPGALDNQDLDAFALSMMATWSIWALLVVALAIVGWVRRVVPLPASIAMAVGALATPMLGPAGWALIGAGLLLWAVRVLRAERAETSAVLPADAVAA